MDWKVGQCDRKEPVTKETQRLIIAAYLDVLNAYQREVGTVNMEDYAICDDLHGLYCAALYECEEFHKLIQEVCDTYIVNTTQSWDEACAVLDKFEELLYS